MQPKNQVLCIGLAVVDLLVRPVDASVFSVDTLHVEPIEFLSGGDALNQATALADLGVGVALLACIGQKGLGDALVQRAEERGIDTSFVVRDAQTAPATSVVLITKEGQRHFLYNEGSNAVLSAGHVPDAAFDGVQVVSVGSLLALPSLDGAGVAQVLKSAKAHGALTVADATHDGDGTGLKKLLPVLPYIDYFVPSIGEAQALLGPGDPVTYAQKLREYGVGNVIIKLGEQGCHVSCGSSGMAVPTYRVPVVDTTGCGDAFVAGFIAGLLRGWDAPQCARLGNVMGALNAMQVGANACRRSLDEVLRFMDEASVLRGA